MTRTLQKARGYSRSRDSLKKSGELWNNSFCCEVEHFNMRVYGVGLRLRFSGSCRLSQTLTNPRRFWLLLWKKPNDVMFLFKYGDIWLKKVRQRVATLPNLLFEVCLLIHECSCRGGGGALRTIRPKDPTENQWDFQKAGELLTKRKSDCLKWRVAQEFYTCWRVLHYFDWSWGGVYEL